MGPKLPSAVYKMLLYNCTGVLTLERTIFPEVNEVADNWQYIYVELRETQEKGERQEAEDTELLWNWNLTLSYLRRGRDPKSSAKV